MWLYLYDIIATIMGSGFAVSYKATLCISKLPTFLYWHKRNGGGGWSVAIFLFWCIGWEQLFAFLCLPISIVFCLSIKSNVLLALAYTNTKSMTVKNGGCTIVCSELRWLCVMAHYISRDCAVTGVGL